MFAILKKIHISIFFKPDAYIVCTSYLLRSIPKGFYVPTIIGLSMKYGLVLKVIVGIIFS